MPTPSSRRQIIASRCAACVCNITTSKSNAQLIRECASTDCPLHAYRPGAGTVQAAALSHGEEEATT